MRLRTSTALSLLALALGIAGRLRPVLVRRRITAAPGSR